MVISADGRKRKLVIKDCKITDAGMYKCVSNADQTEAELVINCTYSLFYDQLSERRISFIKFLNKIKTLLFYRPKQIQQKVKRLGGN